MLANSKVKVQIHKGKKMKSILFNFFFITLLFAFTACGGGGDQQETATTDDAVRTIEIIGTDLMKFVVSEAEDGLVTGAQSGDYIILEAIEASPGEEIRVTLRTISDIPKVAMAHNFVLLTFETDAEEFYRASIRAADNDYIAPDYEDRVIVATDLLGDGETDSVTFTVPDEPGEYVFICSFPGHFDAGMVGKIIVQ